MNDRPEALKPPPERGGAPPRRTIGIADVATFLKDFKELLGFLVMFATGAFWAWSYVATKVQVEELRCLLQTQIDLLRSQTEHTLITRDLLEVTLRLEGIQRRSGTPDEQDRKMAADLALQLDVLKTRRGEADTKRNRLESFLQTNGCAND